MVSKLCSLFEIIFKMKNERTQVSDNFRSKYTLSLMIICVLMISARWLIKPRWDKNFFPFYFLILENYLRPKPQLQKYCIFKAIISVILSPLLQGEEFIPPPPGIAVFQLPDIVGKKKSQGHLDVTSLLCYLAPLHAAWGCQGLAFGFYQCANYKGIWVSPTGSFLTDLIVAAMICNRCKIYLCSPSLHQSLC